MLFNTLLKIPGHLETNENKATHIQSTEINTHRIVNIRGYEYEEKKNFRIYELLLGEILGNLKIIKR